MKKLKGFIALILLFITWLTLFWVTGYRTPWRFFQKANMDSIEIPLGDIPVQNYDRMGFTGGSVCCVNRINGWLVGTERGELFLFDNQGRQVWKRALGIGKLTALALSKDEQVVYVGERSPNGLLYALNVDTGDIQWKYASSEVIGSVPEKRSYPGVVHLDVDAEGNIYAIAYRYMINQKRIREYNSRVLSFLPNGTIRWKFPQDGAMDTWLNWCTVDNVGKRVAVATSAYELIPGMKYPKLLYIFDKDTGKPVKDVALAPIEPFKTVVMRGSPNYSADGKYLAGSASDGRGFLFDSDGKVLWERELSKAEKVEGAWINASGRDGYIVPEGVVFTTINTFNRENWQLPTPVLHPNNNTMFVFSTAGDFKFKFQADGEIEGVAFAKGVAACAAGRNIRTHDFKNAHAALLVSLRDGSLIEKFPTEGPLQAIDISGDGSFIGGIEAPAVIGGGKVIGAHKFHIWRVNKQQQ